jgi:aminobenzoyl-glutamate transport protein
MRGCAIVAAIVAALQVALFLVSWLITAASPETSVRSLLSNEGIRWFFGTFTSNVASAPLTWIVVAAMAYGALRQSGMISTLAKPKPRTYRQAFALRIVLAELLLFAIIIVVVAFIPHAALLSVTGELFPSSFSRALIPIVAFTVTILSVVYGLLSAHFLSWQQVFEGMTDGIRQTLPLWVVYLFAAQLIQSLIYAFA